MNQLMMKHEAEKNCIRQFYVESRELLREFVMEKLKEETEELTSNDVHMVSMSKTQPLKIKDSLEISQKRVS